MSTENANLHDEAARGYLKEILVFDEMERLRLARQVLCGIFVISEPIRQVFELLKIGALPLVTLVISFYFPNTSAR
ncbi:TPA: hypothetical protein LLS86_001155 [Serratia liquefaciens]|nr:hypothetical protein [Serratia liquefaciens]